MTLACRYSKIVENCKDIISSIISQKVIVILFLFSVIYEYVQAKVIKEVETKNLEDFQSLIME